MRRKQTGEILRRLEALDGVKLVALKMVQADREWAKRHYRYEDIAVRHGEQTWNWLLDFICETPLVAAVLEGPDCVRRIREVVGPTDPAKAAPGTIRGDLSTDSMAASNAEGRALENAVHASATPEEGEMEVAVWFRPEELFDYSVSP